MQRDNKRILKAQQNDNTNPFPLFPLEIQELIFSNLSYSAAARVSSVSKQWFSLYSNNQKENHKKIAFNLINDTLNSGTKLKKMMDSYTQANGMYTINYIVGSLFTSKMTQNEYNTLFLFLKLIEDQNLSTENGLNIDPNEMQQYLVKKFGVIGSLNRSTLTILPEYQHLSPYYDNNDKTIMNTFKTINQYLKNAHPDNRQNTVKLLNKYLTLISFDDISFAYSEKKGLTVHLSKENKTLTIKDIKKMIEPTFAENVAMVGFIVPLAITALANNISTAIKGKKNTL